MKLVRNFMVFFPASLASSLAEECVHSCAAAFTVTLAKLTMNVGDVLRPFVWFLVLMQPYNVRSCVRCDDWDVASFGDSYA